MYESLRTGVDANSLTLAAALANLPFAKPIGSLTICGQSLGGALATLVALDIAVKGNSAPRFTPTPVRVSVTRRLSASFLPSTFRIANRADLVPKLPLPPSYAHVLGLFELSSVELAMAPKIPVKPDLACEHYLSSYLSLLSRSAVGPTLNLDAKCVP